MFRIYYSAPTSQLPHRSRGLCLATRTVTRAEFSATFAWQSLKTNSTAFGVGRNVCRWDAPTCQALAEANQVVPFCAIPTLRLEAQLQQVLQEHFSCLNDDSSIELPAEEAASIVQEWKGKLSLLPTPENLQAWLVILSAVYDLYWSGKLYRFDGTSPEVLQSRRMASMVYALTSWPNFLLANADSNIFDTFAAIVGDIKDNVKYGETIVLDTMMQRAPVVLAKLFLAAPSEVRSNISALAAVFEGDVTVYKLLLALPEVLTATRDETQNIVSALKKLRPFLKDPNGFFNSIAWTSCGSFLPLLVNSAGNLQGVCMDLQQFFGPEADVGEYLAAAPELLAMDVGYVSTRASFLRSSALNLGKEAITCDSYYQTARFYLVASEREIVQFHAELQQFARLLNSPPRKLLMKLFNTADVLAAWGFCEHGSWPGPAEIRNCCKYMRFWSQNPQFLQHFARMKRQRKMQLDPSDDLHIFVRSTEDVPYSSVVSEAKAIGLLGHAFKIESEDDRYVHFARMCLAVWL